MFTLVLYIGFLLFMRTLFGEEFNMPSTIVCAFFAYLFFNFYGYFLLFCKIKELMDELEITSKYARRIVNNIKNLALRSRNIFGTEIKEFKQDEIAEYNLQQLEIIDDTKHPIDQDDIINEKIIGDNVSDTK